MKIKISNNNKINNPTKTIKLAKIQKLLLEINNQKQNKTCPKLINLKIQKTLP